MRPLVITGTWRTFARLRSYGHVATVEWHGSLFVVSLNGAALSACDNWRNALAYAANLLASRPGA